MKKVILTMIIVIVLVISLLGKQQNQMDQNRAAIRQAVPDYLDGLHEGNLESMEQALHPDSAKRGVGIGHSSAFMMVEVARAGYGNLKLGEDMKTEISILDRFGNIAGVNALSA